MSRAQILKDNSLVDYLRKRGFDLKKAGANYVTNACPIGMHEPGHRPVTIDTAKELWHCNDHERGGSIIDWIALEENITPAEVMKKLGGDTGRSAGRSRLVKAYDYTDAKGKLLYQKCRWQPKRFNARRPDGKRGWIWNLKGVNLVLYHLPAVLAAQEVCLPEGEKDADNLTSLGFVATTNPLGAGKWQPQYSEALRGKDVVIFGDVGDKDSKGENHTALRIEALSGIAKSIKHVHLPNGAHDISDYIAALRRERKEPGPIIRNLIDQTPVLEVKVNPAPVAPIAREDFYAYMPMHNYIFTPTREVWPASSVNSRLPAVVVGADEEGNDVTIAASRWLDQKRPVEQMTWAPGFPMLIEHRLISEGGWIDRHGCRTFNLYRPPTIVLGDPDKAEKWLDHVATLYPEDVSHILYWLAHRVQRPHEKINHALFLGGPQGIGKDTLLYPVKRAVGLWNVQEILPPALLGRFNGFVKSVILCVNEVHDLGDLDRYGFYERLKAYTAAPPDVIRVDEKHLREYSVFNVCGVVLTSNFKTAGLYLPADDRRHYVAWSDISKDHFPKNYWRDIYAWFDREGCRHVAAYLAQLDLSHFNPKAPPEKTNAFWEIVESSRAPENAELADALQELGNPDAVTIKMIVDVLPDTNEFRYWLKDRKNARMVPHRFEECGYVVVRNTGEMAGRWKIGKNSYPVYAKKTLSRRDQIIAVRKLIEEIKSRYP